PRRLRGKRGAALAFSMMNHLSRRTKDRIIAHGGCTITVPARLSSISFTQKKCPDRRRGIFQTGV
ncbi:hypothetical protein, partial [Pseudomonas carnis]|uniref:hypothetical protein n=1 Tax=Pseudomonas carnis TaxID=2487355 RepID=UPI001F1B6A34